LPGGGPGLDARKQRPAGGNPVRPGPIRVVPAAGLPRRLAGRRRRTLIVALLTARHDHGRDRGSCPPGSRREALDTNQNFTNTSSKPARRTRLSGMPCPAYLVNEVFSSTDVCRSPSAASLPPPGPGPTPPRPPPASRSSRGGAAPEAARARPRVQQAWRNANRAAHQQFLRILNGGGSCGVHEQWRGGARPPHVGGPARYEAGCRANRWAGARAGKARGASLPPNAGPGW